MSIITAYAFAPILFSTDDAGYTTGSIKSRFSINPKSLRGKEAINRIISGDCRGVSPEIKIGYFTCSICKRNIEDCDHKLGAYYEGKECMSFGTDCTPLGCTLLSSPKDPRCFVTDLLVIELDNDSILYSWYGFAVDRENTRFKNIQSALDDHILEENVALTFGKLFSQQLYGIAKAETKLTKKTKRMLQKLSSIPSLPLKNSCN